MSRVKSDLTSALFVMKKVFSSLAGSTGIWFLPSTLRAQNAGTASIDQLINEAMTPVTDFMFGIVFFPVPVGGGNMMPIVVIWLIIAAVAATLFLWFVNIRGFRHAIDLVRGIYDAPGKQNGEVSHFQALTAALSATVGLGNIAGVAVAISLGGPGATFWMIMGGLVGMSLKFVECTLGVKYRKINEDGSVSGGPMYYLSRGFAEKGFPWIGKALAFFFALMCIGGSIGGGNMFQANQAFKQTVIATGGEQSILYQQGWLFGLIMAVLVGIVIIGGIKGIVRVTSKLVPFMVAVYISAALFIIFSSFDKIPAAFEAIINGAFAPEAIYGGAIGVLIQGIKRAAFSNEAGIGSASIAHSAVKTGEPLTEGFVALLEPFIDTVVICTMTALVIVTTLPVETITDGGLTGISLTLTAFTQILPWSGVPLGIAAILFAVSTMIAWAYYGQRGWLYLVGKGTKRAQVFNLVYCLFIIIGASVPLGTVLDFADALIFVMAIPNIIGLYVLAGEIKNDLAGYWTTRKQAIV